jgi:hypothetical protein
MAMVSSGIKGEIECNGVENVIVVMKFGHEAAGSHGFPLGILIDLTQLVEADCCTTIPSRIKIPSKLRGPD